MLSTLFVLIAIAFLVGTQANSLSLAAANHALQVKTKGDAGKRILVWMCLEFCQETAEEIQANINQITKHQNILSAVSFEKYTLGPNSTLVDNNLTEVASTINNLQLEAWPLLSSYPHPAEFMDWMRQVFQQPDPFIQSCVSEAKKYNYVGYTTPCRIN